MTARIGAFIALAFAAVWLWVGAHALPTPWAAIVGGAGVLMLAAVGWRVMYRPVKLGSTGRFNRTRFLITVALEVVGALLVGLFLGQAGLVGYQWPALGVIVALHFIGLWWASGDRRYLALTAGMLTVNVVALCFAPDSVAMLGVAGLGSSAALALTLVAR